MADSIDVTESPSPSDHRDGSLSDHDKDTPKKRFLWLFTLNPSVSHTNFVVYLLAAAWGICLFVFLNSSQGFVLGQILSVPTDQLGNASGSLTFYDELVSIVAVWGWGIHSDCVGRRIVYGTGFSIMAISLALFTYARTLYPELLLYRLIFALGGGASSSMMTATLADYASDEDRGKTSGLVGLVSGCGALVALFVLLRLPPRFGDGLHGLRVTFWIVAGLSLAFALTLWMFLQTKRNSWKDMDLASGRKLSSDSLAAETSSTRILPHSEQGSITEQHIDRDRKKPLFVLAREGIWAAKDCRILLGYAGSFLARGDTIILTLFLPLWIYKHYIDSGQCPNAGSPDDPDIKENCRVAYRTASIMGGIAQTCALLGAPLFGWLADRFYRPLPLLFAGLLGLLSYLLTFLQPDPTVTPMYIYMCLIGLAEIGLVVGSLSLVTAAYVPAGIRGSVAGVSSLCGAAGILINTKLGGHLFDTWTEGAPFFVMVVGHVVFCLVAASVIIRDLVHAKKGGRGDVDEASLMGVMRKEFETKPVEF